MTTFIMWLSLLGFVVTLLSVCCVGIAYTRGRMRGFDDGVAATKDAYIQTIRMVAHLDDQSLADHLANLVAAEYYSSGQFRPNERSTKPSS